MGTVKSRAVNWYATIKLNQDVLVNVTISMFIIYLKGGAINRDVLLFATLRYTNPIDNFGKFDLILK